MESDNTNFFDMFLDDNGQIRQSPKVKKTNSRGSKSSKVQGQPTEKKEKKKYKRNYGDIANIKDEFKRSRLSDFSQQRLRSFELHKLIYGDHGLRVPSLKEKLSKDFFTYGWVEDFYYSVISYDFVHSGELQIDDFELLLEDFLDVSNKKIKMEIAIPIEQEAEFNLHKAYCFLRSFVDPYFENEIGFSNIEDVTEKMRYGKGETKFAFISVYFRNYQFFQMFNALLTIIYEARSKEIDFTLSFCSESNCLEFIINDIGELDLEHNLKFDYFLWRHPLKFTVYGFDLFVYKFFNFQLVFETFLLIWYHLKNFFKKIVMKYLISKDKIKRKKFQNYEKNRINFLFFAKNKILLSSSQSKRFFKTKNFPTIKYLSRTRNLCYLTGRAHSVYSDFKLSRMSLKEAFNKGLFPGIQKSSW